MTIRIAIQKSPQLATKMATHIRPLGFHRVMERNPIAAHDSPLFNCPTEVLADIVDHLGADPKDFASLALVNSDCRQLARSWQFCKITMDSTPRAEAILALLLLEADLRQQNKLGLSLGACIRHIETGSSGYWKKVMAVAPRKPGFSADDNDEEAWDEDTSKMEQWRRQAEIMTLERELFVRRVHHAMTSLPHLYTLELTAETVLDQPFINLLLSFTTVRHLDKARFSLTEEIPRVDASVEWPLETLDVTLSWDWEYGYERENLDASQHLYQLLRPCAPSLQSLKLSYSTLRRPGKELDTPVAFDLHFPQLRHLEIGSLCHRDVGPSALRSLILTSDWLSFLSVDLDNRQALQILQEAGSFRNLKTLVLKNFLAHASEAEKTKRISMAFLKDKPQLSAVAFKKPTKPQHLEGALSILRHFPLARLSMSWEGNESLVEDNVMAIVQPSSSQIPPDSLGALSKMMFLEDLHLDCVSTARMNVWKRDWYVDHSVLREHLGQSLCNLKRLALTRDIYEYTLPYHPFIPVDMALLPGMPRNVLWKFTTYSDLRSNDDWWAMHVQHMREQALEYAETFPRLEFLYIGERSFRISRDEDTGIGLDESDDQELRWVVGGAPGV